MQCKKEKKKKECVKRTHDDISFLMECLEHSDTVTIPDLLIQFELNQVGSICPDIRVQRLIGCAAKLFLFRIVKAAMDYRNHIHKKKKHNRPNTSSSNSSSSYNSEHPILEINYLIPALRNYGIVVNKPLFYITDNEERALKNEKK